MLLLRLWAGVAACHEGAEVRLDAARVGRDVRQPLIESCATLNLPECRVSPAAVGAGWPDAASRWPLRLSGCTSTGRGVPIVLRRWGGPDGGGEWSPPPLEPRGVRGREVRLPM